MPFDIERLSAGLGSPPGFGPSSRDGVAQPSSRAEIGSPNDEADKLGVYSLIPFFAGRNVPTPWARPTPAPSALDARAPTLSPAPAPPLSPNEQCAYDELRVLGMGEGPCAAARQQGILSWTLHELKQWLCKAPAKGLPPGFVLSIFATGVLTRNFGNTLSALMQLDMLPLVACNGRAVTPPGQQLYLLGLPTHLGALEGTLLLNGDTLAELLRQPAGLWVLWSTMLHHEALRPLWLQQEHLLQLGCRHDGNEVLEVLAYRLQTLFTMGFLPSDVRQLLFVDAAARKILLAVGHKKLFEEGRITPEGFVVAAQDRSMGISALEVMLLGERHHEIWSLMAEDEAGRNILTER